MKNNGQILIITIILIMFATIMVIGISIFLAQILNLNIARANQSKAIYAAQAGAYKAIVDFQNVGAWSTETDTQISGNIYYSISASSSDFLRIDANSSKVLGGGRILRDIFIHNANTTDDIILDTITITWDPDGGETLQKISFALGVFEWTGTASSGTTITLPFTFVAGGDYNLELNWIPGDNIRDATITAQLDFSDGSSRTVYLLISGEKGSDSLSITATGKVAAKDTWKRTINATYDVTSQEIMSWQEISEHI